MRSKGNEVIATQADLGTFLLGVVRAHSYATEALVEHFEKALGAALLSSEASVVARTTTKPHDLHAAWPWFLDVLDTDRPRALAGFGEFIWKLLDSHPPAIFISAFQEADRGDLIQEIYEKCAKNNCAKLRTYQNRGKSFSKWLYVVAYNHARDVIRRRRPTEDVDEGIGHTPVFANDSPLTQSEWIDLLEKAYSCIEELPEKQRLLLFGAMQGLSGVEIAREWMGWPASQSVKALNDLRYARVKLRQCLVSKGIDPDDYFPSRKGSD